MTSERARVVKELSGFKLLKELGQGGMGKVFLARQTSLDRVVALKVLVPELAADAEFIARFHREAKSAARFQHPNIVAVFDQGQDPTSGVHYIAFEFVDGGSLEELLERRQRLPEAEALPIIRAIATALEYAEAAGIVHRDVKPENILLTKLGLPKLADLGLAKQTGVASSVTQSGVVLGTPIYMAPEQALGEPDLDGRADLYALGLCLWRVLTGVVPFDENRDATPLQLLAKHINQDLPDVRARAPEVSEGLAKIITWLAARDRAERYGSATDVAADLDLVMRGEAPLGPHDRETVLFKAKDLRRTPSGRVPTAPPPPAPRLPVPTAPILAGVLVGALGIGVGLALAVAGRRPRGPARTDTTEVATPTTEVATPIVRRTSEPAPTLPSSVGTEPAEAPEPLPLPVPSTTGSSPTLVSLTTEPTTTEAVVEPRPTSPERERAVRLGETVEAGLKQLREALLHDADGARPAWDALSTDLEAFKPTLAADPESVAAVGRLSSAVEAFLALLEADGATRLGRERALDGIIAASAAAPLDSKAGRAVDGALATWAVLLADVAELDGILGETVAAERDKRAEKLRTPDLKQAAKGLLIFSRVLDAAHEREPRGPRGREDRDELRAASARRGALSRLLEPSLSDLEATLQLQRAAQRSDQGGPAVALARVSIKSGARPSPFLDVRVVDVAPSSTGRALGSARGMLIAAERPFAPGETLEVYFGANVIAIDAKAIVVNGNKTYETLAWGERPVIVLEMRRSPLIVALDPRTGEVLASRDVSVPGQASGTQPFSYGVVGLGLTRVALIQPVDGEARDLALRAERARADRPRAWRD